MSDIDAFISEVMVIAVWRPIQEPRTLPNSPGFSVDRILGQHGIGREIGPPMMHCCRLFHRLGSGLRALSILCARSARHADGPDDLPVHHKRHAALDRHGALKP
jgi:hypothetical protein